MTAPLLSPADPEQVLLFMGTPPGQADGGLWELVARCDRAVRDAAQPRWLSRTLPLCQSDRGVRLRGGPLLPGEDLRAHLAGCDRAVVLCATLGAQVDRLIRAAQCTDVLEALALDCCATVLIEQLCDLAEERIHRDFPGCHFPYRYSPGYGDLPVDLNPALLELLDAPIKLGLCATSSRILTPRKSVTAILGVSDHPIDSHKRSCLSCPAREGCAHRKTGGHCGIS